MPHPPTFGLQHPEGDLESGTRVHMLTFVGRKLLWRETGTVYTYRPDLEEMLLAKPDWFYVRRDDERWMTVQRKDIAVPGGPMPTSNITGRDGLIILEALTTALIALEQLPRDKQPANSMGDMRLLLSEISSASVSAHLALATCRLFPDLDPDAVYQKYGLLDDDGVQ